VERNSSLAAVRPRPGTTDVVWSGATSASVERSLLQRDLSRRTVLCQVNSSEVHHGSTGLSCPVAVSHLQSRRTGVPSDLRCLPVTGGDSGPKTRNEGVPGSSPGVGLAHLQGCLSSLATSVAPFGYESGTSDDSFSDGEVVTPAARYLVICREFVTVRPPLTLELACPRVPASARECRRGKPQLNDCRPAVSRLRPPRRRGPGTRRP
jgi:hypothetical protein